MSRDLLIFYTYLVGADEVRRLRAFYGCFATGRSLAKLVNCYRDRAAPRDLLIFNAAQRLFLRPERADSGNALCADMPCLLAIVRPQPAQQKHRLVEVGDQRLRLLPAQRLRIRVGLGR